MKILNFEIIYNFVYNTAVFVNDKKFNLLINNNYLIKYGWNIKSFKIINLYIFTFIKFN